MSSWPPTYRRDLIFAVAMRATKPLLEALGLPELTSEASRLIAREAIERLEQELEGWLARTSDALARARGSSMPWSYLDALAEPQDWGNALSEWARMPPGAQIWRGSQLSDVEVSAMIQLGVEALRRHWALRNVVATVESEPRDTWEEEHIFVERVPETSPTDLLSVMLDSGIDAAMLQEAATRLPRERLEQLADRADQATTAGWPRFRQDLTRLLDLELSPP